MSRFFVILFIGVFVSTLSIADQVQDRRKKDALYLQYLKKELARASDRPGGLEDARRIQSEIERLSKGTSVVTMEEAEMVQPTQQSPLQHLPKKHARGVVELTHSRGGRDLDLFHDKTVTVGEDYGAPRDVVREKVQQRHQQPIKLYTPLEMPGGGTLRAPGEVDRPKPPVKNISLEEHIKRTSTKRPSFYGDPKVMVDAQRFQTQKPEPKPQHKAPALYGSTAHLPQGKVVPSVYKRPEPKKVHPSTWGVNRQEVAYLEEKLKTKLAQLVHARRKMRQASLDEAHAWTERIYALETEKRSLLRMMKELGVKPSFTKVSLSEDPEFDTVQSEEFLLKRQLEKVEKEEHRLRRQLRHTADPEQLPQIGERLHQVEQNKRLLEASLRDLKANHRSLNTAEITSRPRIFRPEPEKKEPQVEENVQAKEEKKPQVFPVEEPKSLRDIPAVGMQAPRYGEMLPHAGAPREIDIEEEDYDIEEHHSGSFWSGGVPESGDRRVRKHEASRRIGHDEAVVISGYWKDS